MVASILIRKVLDSLAYCAYSLFRFFHFLYLRTHQRDCRGGRRGWIIACLHRTCSGAEAEGLLPDVGTPHWDSASGRGCIIHAWQRALTESLGTEPGTGGGRGALQRATERGICNPKRGKRQRGRQAERNQKPVFPTCQAHIGRNFICIEIKCPENNCIFSNHAWKFNTIFHI